MYAVIETGGKQYNVKVGDMLRIEKLDKSKGDIVNDFKVLMVVTDTSVEVGTPYIDGVSVSAKVIEQGRARKVRVFKYKPKKNIRKRMGHRQPFTTIVIDAINA